MATTKQQQAAPREQVPSAKHTVAGIHSHAEYESDADVAARLAAARGDPTPPQLPPLPPPAAGNP